MSKIARPDHPVNELIARRFSPYGFSARPVADEELRSLFEAARWAASSFNEQPWSYIVATRGDGEAFAEMLSCLVEGNREWAAAAPVLALGVVARNFSRNGKPNRVALHDLGLASGNLSVEATARGLHLHQMGGILPDRAREVYAIPADHDATTGLAIGYLAADSEDVPAALRARDVGERMRKPLAEFVFGGRFGSTAGLLSGS